MDLGEALLEAWYQAWMKVTGTVPGGRHQKALPRAGETLKRPMDTDTC